MYHNTKENPKGVIIRKVLEIDNISRRRKLCIIAIQEDMKEAKEKEEREVNKPCLLFSLGPRTKHQNYLEKVLKFMEDESFKCD